MRWWPILLLIPLSGCVTFWTGQIDPVEAPSIHQLDTDGQPFTLNQTGPVLIDFMGTWCTPCQRAVPILRDLQEAYPELTIVSVSGTDTAEQVNDFRTRFGAHWPHLVNASVAETYREAGSSSTVMMWPSYALVVDGELVFYNRGETLPATFASAIDQHVERQAPAVESDVAAPVALSFIMGALAWFSPWLNHIVLETPRRRPSLSPGLAVVLFGGLGLAAAYGSRPLSGRVATVAPFLVVAAVLAVVFWRWKGAQASGKRLADDGWRHAWALHGNFLWYALPAWGAVLHAALLRTAPIEALLMVGAFGAGAVLADLAVARGLGPRLATLGERAGWIGISAVLIGAGWNGVLYLR